MLPQAIYEVHKITIKHFFYLNLRPYLYHLQFLKVIETNTL